MHDLRPKVSGSVYSREKILVITTLPGQAKDPGRDI
jgi:hypothetical protein